MCAVKLWLFSREFARGTAYYWQAAVCSEAHIQNIQNISEISQESSLYQSCCCLGRPGLWSDSKQREYFQYLSRILSGVQWFLYPQDWVTLSFIIFLLLALVLCISCLHGSQCCVTFPLQRKPFHLETQVFLSHQALLVSCVNGLWIKPFICGLGSACYQQAELIPRQVEQTNCPCSKGH